MELSTNTKLMLVSAAGAIVIVRYAPEFAIKDSLGWTFTSLFVIQFIARVIWVAILYPRFFSPLRDIPTVPGGYPLIGQFTRIFGEPSGLPHKEWLANVPNNGLIRYTHLLNKERLAPTTPQTLAEVLVTRSYDFQKPEEIRFGLGRVLGIGILLAEGDEHKRQRRNLLPAFSFRHVKDLYPIFWNKAREVTEAMTNTVRRSSSPDEKTAVAILQPRDWASRCTLDIIGTAGLGQDFRSIGDPDNELNSVYQKIFNPGNATKVLQLMGFFFPHWFLHILPVKQNEEFVKAIRIIKQTCLNLISSKKAKLETDKGHREDVDILSVALESGGFSDENLQNQLMTFLAAGHETTASAMTWASYILSLHPDVQTRLREEIRANLPSISDHSAEIDSTKIDRLPYLSAVCNEIIRLYPPAPLTIRQAARDTFIAGHPIPAGTSIMIPIWAINTNKALWGPDADEFNPERWLKPGQAGSGGAQSNYAFMTFLHGPRSCIGQRFAQAEFAVLLAAWAGRFHFELADKDYKLEIQGGATMKPAKGFSVLATVVEGW